MINLIVRFAALAVFVSWVPTVSGQEMEAYVPIRAITSGEQPHWFGYYDKHQFDSTGRYVLGMRPPFEGCTPGAEDVLEVGYVDLQDGDRWTTIGTSRAWNWQQGCMLQWIPESDEIIYNDRRDGDFVSVIHDRATKTERVLPYPIYTVSPDGKHAATLNFARLAYTRPGYGYTGVPYTKLDAMVPEDEGVFLLDLKTGERRLIQSLKEIAAVDHRESMDSGLNWVNHLLFSTDGSRLIFLHRWRESMDLSSGWKTRMFTVGSDGSAPRIVADHGMVSHFIWRNPQEILAWSSEPDTGSRYHLYDDAAGTATVIGEGVLTRDGHCTYSPDGDWILTDTYPDRDRMQQLMLYRPSDGALVPLGKFHLSPDWKGELRCDLHPRFSRDGKSVCIDSMHTGKRQMYLLDVSGLTLAKETN